MSSQVLQPWFQDLSGDVLCALGKLFEQPCFAPCVSIDVNVSVCIDISSIEKTYRSRLACQRFPSRFLCTFLITFSSLAGPLFFFFVVIRSLPLIVVFMIIIEFCTGQISEQLISRVVPVKVSVLQVIV